MSSKDNIKPTRRIKNPETFRERALKVSEQQSKTDKKPAKDSSPNRTTAKLSKPFKKLANNKSLKPVIKVLRFIGRIILPKYLRTSFSELRQVNWPSFRQSRKLTYAVIIFAVIFGSAIAVVDWGLSKIFRHLLLK